jgi:hypothetical protein
MLCKDTPAMWLLVVRSSCPHYEHRTPKRTLSTAPLSSSAAAVGLSYSGVRADYATNDTATAADSNTFLRGFFRRYPHLARNHFYISGWCGAAA